MMLSGYELYCHPEKSTLMEKLSHFLSQEGNEQLDVFDKSLTHKPLDYEADINLLFNLFLPITKSFYEELRNKSINKKQAIKKTINLVVTKYEIEQDALAANQRGEVPVIFFFEEDILNEQ